MKSRCLKILTPAASVKKVWRVESSLSRNVKRFSSRSVAASEILLRSKLPSRSVKRSSCLRTPRRCSKNFVTLSASRKFFAKQIRFGRLKSCLTRKIGRCKIIVKGGDAMPTYKTRRVLRDLEKNAKSYLTTTGVIKNSGTLRRDKQLSFLRISTRICRNTLSRTFTSN